MAKEGGGETYTHGHHDSVLRSHRWRTVDNSAAYLVRHLTPGTSVLDVGCGPGTITLDLAERVAPGTVLGIDSAAGAIAAATRAAEDAGLGNVELRVGDVYALDLPDASVDVVHAHQVLQHVADPVAALREMRRVCRPHGIVAARDCVYSTFTWFPADAELARWHDMYAAVHSANGGEPDAGSRLLAWARAAGFEDIECRASAWCYATAEEVRWWSELWAERTTATALSTRAVELGVATPADLEGFAAAWRRWGGAASAWFSVTHGEILARP